MSTEEKINEDSKETQTEETNKSESTDSAPIEEAQLPSEPAIETKIDKTEDFYQLLKEVKEMSKSYSETIKNLNEELSKTKKELSDFKEETESKRPVTVTATVKGKYDYSKKVADMGYKNLNDYQAYCREVYDRINNAYPTINKLT